MINLFKGIYKWLSNFSYYGFWYRGIWYKTNEHFFQAMITTGEIVHVINVRTYLVRTCLVYYGKQCESNSLTEGGNS